MSKRLKKKKAIRDIESAFTGVTLEDGVSLHETGEIDDYRRVLPNSKSRELDEVLDWRKLVCKPSIQKFCWYGGISFLDAKGFRFHLPAYLITDIRSHMLGDISSIMIGNLTKPGDYRIEGFVLFTKMQKRAVFNALKYLHEYDVSPLDDEELAGLYKYWS